MGKRWQLRATQGREEGRLVRVSNDCCCEDSEREWGADYSTDLCDELERRRVKMLGANYFMRCGRKEKGKLARFDKCQIKSPWGETFDVGPDMSGDGGRVVCSCQEGNPARADMEYICGVRVQKLEEKDNGTWSFILHYEKR